MGDGYGKVSVDDCSFQFYGVDKGEAVCNLANAPHTNAKSTIRHITSNGVSGRTGSTVGGLDID